LKLEVAGFAFGRDLSAATGLCDPVVGAFPAGFAIGELALGAEDGDFGCSVLAEETGLNDPDSGFFNPRLSPEDSGFRDPVSGFFRPPLSPDTGLDGPVSNGSFSGNGFADVAGTATGLCEPVLTPFEKLGLGGT